MPHECLITRFGDIVLLFVMRVNAQGVILNYFIATSDAKLKH